MAHVKYRAVVNAKFPCAVVNGIALYRVADDFLSYGFAKMGLRHDGMGGCHKSTPTLFAEETLFAAFVSIADGFCAAAIGTVRNPNGIFGCQEYFYRIKQCIDCIGGKFFDTPGKFFESSHSNDPPFLRGLSHMRWPI